MTAACSHHAAALRALAAGLMLWPMCGAVAAPVERVSVATGGAQGDGYSACPALSADGRFVAFLSSATNLVPGDLNRSDDVFVRDRVTGVTEMASVATDGTQGDGSCPAISADGRFVAFAATAATLVAGDGNSATDVFVRDRLAGTTERVSISSVGVEGNANSVQPAISGDGRYVAFWSNATNLVPGDNNNVSDVFVRDRLTGTTHRVSLGNGGEQGNGLSSSPAISADGRFVAFQSAATNLIANDSNGVDDVFVRDLLNGSTERISIDSAGQAGNGDSWRAAISADGRIVAFGSDATNLVADDTNVWADVYVRDRQAATTRRVSQSSGNLQGNSPSSSPAISADGRYVAFVSHASTLVPDDTNELNDVFVRDLQTGITSRVSTSSEGGQGNGKSGGAYANISISGDGLLVAFQSDASNLVPNDTNARGDVFVKKVPVFPYEYAAKIVCGRQPDPADLRLAPGVYATTVNIHSPRAGVEFFKKLALAVPPRDQRPGEIYPIAQHVLQYDQAIAVSCQNLLDEVFGGRLPAPYIEGFLVVQSTDSLDVTAVYTTAALDARGNVGPHSSIDVDRVAERHKAALLDVTKSGRYFCDAEPVATECVLVAALYTVNIRNDGAVPATDVVVTDQVSRSDGLPVVVVLAAPADVPPGAIFSLTGPAALRLEIAQLAPAQQVQLRFWSLAVVRPNAQPDELINRVEATAKNADVKASATVVQSFD
jgi:Tol biopolymer transport system component